MHICMHARKRGRMLRTVVYLLGYQDVKLVQVSDTQSIDLTESKEVSARTYVNVYERRLAT